MDSGSRDRFYNFREHPIVAMALRMFSVVEVVEVTAYVMQSRVVAASSTGFTPRQLRFGLAPRATTTATSSTTGGTTPTTTWTGVVGAIPHLVDIASSPNFTAQSSVTWSLSPSGNQRPFPPGIQTDLRAVELRHNYVNFLLAANNPVSAGTDDAWLCQVSFVINCSGQNFGNPA